WPAGGLVPGRDVDALTAHIDLTPTLCSLAEIPIGDDERLDGIDLSPWLREAGNESGAPMSPSDRTLVVDSQRIDFPEKWRKFAVMTQRWRLVNGNELFDMQNDPGQKDDVADRHPDVVAQL